MVVGNHSQIRKQKSKQSPRTFGVSVLFGGYLTAKRLNVDDDAMRVSKLSKRMRCVCKPVRWQD